MAELDRGIVNLAYDADSENIITKTNDNNLVTQTNVGDCSLTVRHDRHNTVTTDATVHFTNTDDTEVRLETYKTGDDEKEKITDEITNNKDDNTKERDQEVHGNLIYPTTYKLSNVSAKENDLIDGEKKHKEDHVKKRDRTNIKKDKDSDNNTTEVLTFNATFGELSDASVEGNVAIDEDEKSIKNSSLKPNEEVVEDVSSSNGDSICDITLPNDMGIELRYKFTGAVFRSFNDKSVKKSWNRCSLHEQKCGSSLKDTHHLDIDIPVAMEKLVQNVKEWSGVSRKESVELNRSQYSLVSCGELTAEAVQLWLSLPEEVKYDPALAPFRQLYEKEHGQKYDPALAPFRQLYEKEHGRETKRSGVQKRLPYVASAPHLNNNIHVVPEEVFKNPKGFDVQFGNDNGNAQGVEVACQKKESKMSRARHYAKMTLLLACWVFFTLVFLMYNEKEHIIRHTSISPGEVKNYIIHQEGDKLSVLLQLSGPFLSENAESTLNASQLSRAAKLEMWLERWEKPKGVDHELQAEKGEPWTIILQNESEIDFSEGEPRSQVLRLTISDAPQLKRVQRSTKNLENNNSTNTKTKLNETDIEKSYNSNTKMEAKISKTIASNLSKDTTEGFKDIENTLGEYAIVIKADAPKTVPFTMSYTVNPLAISEGVIYAAILLCGLYILIIFEVINRTMSAVLVSTLSLATLALVGERPTVEELVSWLDVETLLLLFSMMLLVAIMAETGMFDYLAVYTFEVTKGKLWPLITLLSAITAFLSTFLDNVTTVLLMTPVTIRLCEVMDLDPIPILMSMVLYSNIGGTATPVGDPPNVIIASNKAVQGAGINFTNFTLHMSLGILLVTVQTYVQLRFMFRDTNKLRLNVPRDIQELRHQISIWRRAADSLPHLSKDQLIVRDRLERKVKKLQAQLDVMVKESSKRACPKETFQSTLDEMKAKYKIRDKCLLIKSTVAITFVVIVFFLHSIPELNRVSLGWTALLGAILLLVLADREDLEPILHRVEWSTLLFFASLFVLMEALSKLGLIEFIGGITESLILSVDESARLAVALLLMLWVSGLTSAFVDNIPLTTMMVRVVTSLGSKPNLNLPMAPLIWALSFGACLGGNGTLIGASANVVCAGVAEQHGYKFTFMQFFKIGFPVMIGHLLVASVYLMICHCAFTWH